jgi:hypothetical protein
MKKGNLAVLDYLYVLVARLLCLCHGISRQVLYDEDVTSSAMDWGNDHNQGRDERMSIDGSLSYGDSSEIPFDVLARSSGTQPLSPWSTLAVSAVRQALHDAAEGDYDALLWLLGEGRAWLTAVGLSIDIVDTWSAKL